MEKSNRKPLIKYKTMMKNQKLADFGEPDVPKKPEIDIEDEDEGK